LYGMSADIFRMKPEPTWLMGDIVAPAKSQVRFLVRGHGFDPEGITYSDFSQVDKLYIDRNQFQQVFFNLLSNAIKYALPEPREFRVEIYATVKDGYYRISCSDWGIGIDPIAAPYIFEEGIRGPAEQARHIEGLGLGLYIVGRVVEAHGGHV